MRRPLTNSKEMLALTIEYIYFKTMINNYVDGQLGSHEMSHQKNLRRINECTSSVNHQIMKNR